MRKCSLLGLIIVALAPSAFAQNTDEHEAAIRALLKDAKAAAEYVELMKVDAERSPYMLSTYLAVSRQLFVWKISTCDSGNILKVCADAAAALDGTDQTFAVLSERVGELWGKKVMEALAPNLPPLRYESWKLL